jgi:hypothetical protein
MNSGEIPSTAELYEQASRVSDRLEQEQESGEWGSEPNHDTLSNFFVWDLQPDRFYGKDNIPDEIVVLPNVYGAFANGLGFSLETPLREDEDLDAAEEVLGSGAVENIYGEVEGVSEVDTPQDVMDMHNIASSLGIDIYSFQGVQDRLDDWVKQPQEEIYTEWQETAELSVESYLDRFTGPSVGDSFHEVGEEFSGNGNRTAFVMYADRESERFPEEPIDQINHNYNQGGMAYHTPKTMNLLLKNGILRE